MEWVAEVVKIVGSVGGGGIIGYFVTRKKTNADAKGSELDNVEHVVKLWRELAEENKRENIQLKKEMADIKQQLEEMRLDLTTVHRENKQLKDYLYKRGIDFSIIQNESTIIFNEDKGTDNR